MILRGKKNALSMTEHWGELRPGGCAPLLPDEGQVENKGDPDGRLTHRHAAQLQPAATTNKNKQSRRRRETSRPAPCHTSKVSLHTPHAAVLAPPVIFLLLTE